MSKASFFGGNLRPAKVELALRPLLTFRAESFDMIYDGLDLFVGQSFSVGRHAH
jgi:hypothetical protein